MARLKNKCVDCKNASPTRRCKKCQAKFIKAWEKEGNKFEGHKGRG